MRKVCAIVGYYGGLRNIELRSIEFGQIFDGGELSFEVDQAGYWFCFERGKQRGMPETSIFCVPRRQSDWEPVCSSSARSPVDFDPASVIDQYLHILESDLKLTRDQLKGAFFKSTHGKNGKFFRNTPMGKNLLSKVGYEFAEELLLPNPQCFTGHCWRRSCGTNASDAGVNVTTLMAQLGWSTPKTAIGYVKKSRATSFQMSMFLSNCQRQNKSLDLVLSTLGPLAAVNVERNVQLKGKRSRKKSVSKSSTVSSIVIPVVDPHLSGHFSDHLSLSRNLEVIPRTIETRQIVSDRNSVLKSINQSLAADRGLSVDSSTDGNLGRDQIGRGGGNPDIDGGGGDGEGGSGVSVDVRVVDRESRRSVDSELEARVASILSNLNHQGELHVHFHFSK